MTATFKYLTLLEDCFEYANTNSLTRSRSKTIVAKVVKLKALENYLNENISTKLQEVLTEYDNLQQFFMDNYDYNFFDSELGYRWNCEVMTVNQYQRRLQENRQFLPLEEYISYKEYIFVVYYTPKKYSDITKNLSDSIYRGLKEHHLPECQYDVYRNIRNRVNAMIEDAFPDIWATAELIGAVKKGLASENSKAVMAIRFHSSSFKADAKFLDQENWETSPCNVEYISKLLTKTGMENIETSVEANRCKFYDPITKKHGRISTDFGLVYERDEMILEYFKSDKRVKPLVAAITKYVEINRLERSKDFQLLGSTSYIFMALHFLMCGLKNPVIVSLQNLPVECKSTTCRFNKSNGRTLTKFKHEIQEYYIRYHDCVRIKNSVTGECSSVGGFSENSESTIWISKNDDNLGSLLIDFFKFYSYSKNYKSISIINSDGKIAGSDYEVNRAPVFIQDPYIIPKNISIACTRIKRKIIIDAFTAAKNSLIREASFERICQVNVERSTEISPLIT